MALPETEDHVDIRSKRLRGVNIILETKLVGALSALSPALCEPRKTRFLECPTDPHKQTQTTSQSSANISASLMLNLLHLNLEESTYKKSS